MAACECGVPASGPFCMECGRAAPGRGRRRPYLKNATMTGFLNEPALPVCREARSGQPLACRSCGLVRVAVAVLRGSALLCAFHAPAPSVPSDRAVCSKCSIMSSRLDAHDVLSVVRDSSARRFRQGGAGPALAGAAKDAVPHGDCVRGEAAPSGQRERASERARRPCAGLRRPTSAWYAYGAGMSGDGGSRGRN